MQTMTPMDLDTEREVRELAREHARTLRLLAAAGLEGTERYADLSAERAALLEAADAARQARAETETERLRVQAAARRETEAREDARAALVADAAEWLRKQLAGGPTPREDVLAAAREAEVADFALRPALDKLDVHGLCGYRSGTGAPDGIEREWCIGPWPWGGGRHDMGRATL